MKINNILFRIILCSLLSLMTIGIFAQGHKVEIQRFDKDFYNYLQKPNKSAENKLRSNYPDLLPAFMQIAQGENSSTADFAAIKSYFNHPMLKAIYADEIRILADLSATEKSLSAASILVFDELGKRRMPRFAVHVSGFKENVIVLDSIISISGDKYLGKNYKNYAQFFSESERTRMQSRSIARDLLKAWILSERVILKEKDENLLSAMIYEGKVLFLLSKLLPDYTKDEIGLFTSSEAKLLELNKSEIWKIIIKDRLLFSTDRMLISNFVDENPRSLPIVGKTPSRSGTAIGWEIVEQYARQTNASLAEILKTDAATILKVVRYNP